MGDFEKEQARLLALYEELQSDLSSGSEKEDELDIENVVQDKFDSSEEDNMAGSDSSEEDNMSDSDSSEEVTNISEIQVDNDPFYLGKDKVTKWYKMPKLPSKNVKTRAENIISHLPCVRREFREAKTPLDCWKLFVTDDMLQEIVLRTNDKIREKAASYSRENKYKVKETSIEELLSFFGLLYLSGFYRSGRQNLDDLWASDDTGIMKFRKAMPLYRFRFLLASLRFDNSGTRIERQKLDKLAAIRAIFDQFVSQCKAVYSPSEYLTIDEQLPSFRGRCSFKQYIPNKPSKYGIKIFALVDARCFYVVNMEVYVGTQPDGPFKQSNSGEDIVIRLIEPISTTGRNITFDNWFTSYPLMQRLLSEHRLTSVGTVRKNKRELPPRLVTTEDRKFPSSMFGFQKNTTVVSYMSKKNKNVILLSTLHHDDSIDYKTNDKQKPEIVTFYNLTKGGVDTLDKLSAAYNISRNSRRWPLTVFFSIMNTAAINAEVVYRNNTNIYTMKRRNFLKTLALQLLENQETQRQNNPRLPRTLRNPIERPARSNSDEHHLPKKRRCEVCPRTSDRKSQYFCVKCEKTVCLTHATICCQECIGDTEQTD